MKKNNILIILLLFPIILSAQSQIYFSDIEGGISRVNENGTNLEEILPSGGSYVNFSDLALDDSQDLLFWIDVYRGRIYSSSLDGSNRSIILDENDMVFIPQKIAINHANNRIVWSEENIIKSANYDGSNISIDFTIPILPDGNGYEILDIEIDGANGKIYWAYNNGGYGIDKANLDGTNIENIVDISSCLKIQDICLDLSRQTILYLLLNGPLCGYPPSVPLLRSVDVDGINDINFTTFDPNIGGWAAIVRDELNDKLYTVSFEEIKCYNSTGGLESETDINPNIAYNLYAIAFSSNSNALYLTEQSRINRVNIDGSNFENLVIDEVPKPAIIDYDGNNDWIYWADEYGYIGRMKSTGEGKERLVLVSSRDKIAGFKLDVGNNKMYYSVLIDGNVSSFNFDGGHYYSANLDGSSQQIIHSLGRWSGYDIQIDTINNMHYWLRYSDITSNYNVPSNYYTRIHNTNINTNVSSDLGMLSHPSGYFHDVYLQCMAFNIAAQEFVYATKLGNTNTIKRATSDHNYQEYIYFLNFEISAIASFENKTYWAEYSSPGFQDMYYSDLDGANVTYVKNIPSSKINSMAIHRSVSLPVELTSFRAYPKGDSNYLEWRTSSETSNEGFEIEKSVDGLEWDRIGYVEGFGNSVISHSYEFMDNHIFHQGNYYRLKQIDYDGTFEYSDIVYVLNENDSKPNIKFFVDQEILDLKLSDLQLDSEFRIRIANVQGEILVDEHIFVNSNEKNLDIDLSRLPFGLYYITIESEGNEWRYIESFIKE